MNSFELANDFANVTCMRIYTQEIKDLIPKITFTEQALCGQ